jgi:hypothetical protein
MRGRAQQQSGPATREANEVTGFHAALSLLFVTEMLCQVYRIRHCETAVERFLLQWPLTKHGQHPGTRSRV